MSVLVEVTCSTGQEFTRENITYMVTDKLEVMPSTTTRNIKVPNKLETATLADLDSNDIIVSDTYLAGKFLPIQFIYFVLGLTLQVKTTRKSTIPRCRFQVGPRVDTAGCQPQEITGVPECFTDVFKLQLHGERCTPSSTRMILILTPSRPAGPRLQAPGVPVPSEIS